MVLLCHSALKLMSNQLHKSQGIIKTKSDIIEILLGYAILIAINLFWFRDNIGFVGVKYHPFWIVILLVAARYGFRGGLMAGLSAAVILLALIKTTNPIITAKTLITYEYLETPLLFIVVGTFLGELRQNQKRKYRDVKTKYETLKKNNTNLIENFKALNDAKKELDTRIIGQEQTVSTLYDAAQDLKSLKEADIYPAVLGILTQFVGAEKCSIYMLSNDKLKLADNSGWEENHNHPTEINLNEGMMGQAFSTKSTTSVNYMLKVENISEFINLNMVVSSPITNNSEQVMGVLNIEKLPFIKFNPQAIRMTSLIADWCGSAIENARTYKETKDKNISDDVTGAYTFSYLNERLTEEFQRAFRYKLILGILFIEIEDFTYITDDFKHDVLSVLGFVLKNNTRRTDFLFNYSKPGQFVFVLPHTNNQGIKVLSNKILKEIYEFKFKPYTEEERYLEIKCGIAEFDNKVKSPDDLIKLALDNL